MYQIGACMQVDADRFNAYRNSEPQCAKQFRVVPMSDIRRINVLRAHWQYVRYDCLASDALRSFNIENERFCSENERFFSAKNWRFLSENKRSLSITKALSFPQND